MNENIKNPSTIPLHAVQSGESVIIASLEGGKSFRQKMIAQGLIPGAEIRILSNHKNSPFLIQNNETKIMLGQGMAKRIFVNYKG